MSAQVPDEMLYYNLPYPVRIDMKNTAIRIHFTNWPTFYARMVSRVTRSPFAHVHIQRMDTGMNFEAAAGRKCGWFERMLPPTRHHYITLRPSVQGHYEIVQFLNSQRGKPYDWLGIIGQALGFRTMSRENSAWYCSNLAAAAYERSVFFANSVRKQGANITPQELYDALKANGYVPVVL